MIEFKAEVFLFLFRFCGALEGIYRVWPRTSDAEDQSVADSSLEPGKRALSGLSDALVHMELPVSATFCQQALECLNREAITYRDFSEKLNLLMDGIHAELRQGNFLYLTMKEAAFFEPKEALFGKDVQDRLPSAVEDISEAGKCFAIERYTAAVFHLMRVMEIGVQKFGEKLGVSLTTALGVDKNWHNLIEESDKKIRALKSASTPDPNASKLARISSNLYNVKLAWRNEVMHPKATYTQAEAEAVFVAVKSFMIELVSFL